jgi:hypothetical protein
LSYDPPKVYENFWNGDGIGNDSLLGSHWFILICKSKMYGMVEAAAVTIVFLIPVKSWNNSLLYGCETNVIVVLP